MTKDNFEDIFEGSPDDNKIFTSETENKNIKIVKFFVEKKYKVIDI